jgi:predicted RNA binding protein YcfA (HicA-like mRNA interferase family)
LPKLPVLTAREAENMLLKAGYAFICSAGIHRIYMKGKKRIVIPFHASRSLHPKIVKEVLEAV